MDWSQQTSSLPSSGATVNIKDYVKGLKISGGQTYRGACPMCGGSNTFTVLNDNGTLIYNCYKASCDVSGAAYKGATLDELSRRLRMDVLDAGASQSRFEPPDTFVLPYGNGEARAFMDRFKLVEPYASGRIVLRYDPRMHRLVFLICDGTTVIDAVGRALRQGDKPKWFRYGNYSEAVLCVPPADSSRKHIAILVEDAVSAVTASSVGTGIALLGTNMPASLPKKLLSLGITKVLLALDPDAAAKAVDIQRELCYYIDTKVWLIKDDLKYYTKGRLMEEVGGLIDESTSNSKL
jgi:hypothetical protein